MDGSGVQTKLAFPDHRWFNCIVGKYPVNEVTSIGYRQKKNGQDLCNWGLKPLQCRRTEGYKYFFGGSTMLGGHQSLSVCLSIFHNREYRTECEDISFRLLAPG